MNDALSPSWSWRAPSGGLCIYGRGRPPSSIPTALVARRRKVRSSLPPSRAMATCRRHRDRHVSPHTRPSSWRSILGGSSSPRHLLPAHAFNVVNLNQFVGNHRHRCSTGWLTELALRLICRFPARSRRHRHLADHHPSARPLRAAVHSHHRGAPMVLSRRWTSRSGFATARLHAADAEILRRCCRRHRDGCRRAQPRQGNNPCGSRKGRCERCIAKLLARRSAPGFRGGCGGLAAPRASRPCASLAIRLRWPGLSNLLSASRRRHSLACWSQNGDTLCVAAVRSFPPAPFPRLPVHVCRSLLAARGAISSALYRSSIRPGMTYACAGENDGDWADLACSGYRGYPVLSYY